MNPLSNSDEAQDKKAVKKGKRRRKEKKQIIEISLWIHGRKYEHGQLCTFCALIQAVIYCPDCADFYCESCDTTAHSTKKRKGHVRSVISKLTLDRAAEFVTRAVRRYGHLRLLQRLCRQKFRRRFDRVTLNYYYVNTVYNTVSWRKPYCLRQQELFPYMTPEYAASKCQGLHRMWKAREKVKKELINQFRKIFDRGNCNFYYAYVGPSKMLPKSSWYKPKLFGRRSFPKDILPIYTRDVAAIIIQRKWRALLILKFFRALTRSAYDEVWDPVKGRFNYYHRESSVLYTEKPKLLRNEAWDPNRIPDWSIEQVSLFLRRIGLKQYVETMKSYFVDGNALFLLDDEDFENLGITNRFHIKKIKVEMKKLYQAERTVEMNEDHAKRRERIRKQKMFQMAAVVIQKYFRRFSAKKELVLRKEIFRIKLLQQRLNQRIQESATWWSDHKDLPSRKLNQTPTISSTGVILPPIKTFGRRKDYLSHKGWGRRGDDLKGTWIPTLAAQIDKKFIGDSSPTVLFSEKLRISGYDEKRKERYLNQALL